MNSQEKLKPYNQEAVERDLKADSRSPMNRILLDERKKAKFERTSGVLALIVGLDLLAMTFTSQALFQSLGSLTHGLMPSYLLIILDVIGGSASIYGGMTLLKYRYGRKLPIWIGCGLGLYLGVALSLVQMTQLFNIVLILVNAQYIGAVILAALAIAFAKKSN